MNNRTFSHIMGSSTFSFTASMSSSSSLDSSINELVNILRKENEFREVGVREGIHSPLEKTLSAERLGKE